MTPAPWHGLIMLALPLHIGAGALALAAGTLAAVAPKGRRLHRRAGDVFAASMCVMAVSAGGLAILIPGQLINVFISAFTLYLVATGWLTARRADGASGHSEAIAFAVAAALAAPFVILSVQLASGAAPFLQTRVPFRGPILIAIYSFTAVLLIAAAGDAKTAFAGGISGSPRIARHLWRMCLGLTLSAGSAFTNGAARLLPGPYHVPPAFFLPQFIPLGVLIFWIIRVRVAGWAAPGPASRARPRDPKGDLVVLAEPPLPARRLDPSA